MRYFRSMVIVTSISMFCVSCDKLVTPTSPSYVYNNSSDSDLSAWSPCVVVQTPHGPPENIQIEAMRKLKSAGRLSWVRFGSVSSSGHGRMYHQAAKSMGLKIMSVVQTDELNTSSSWEHGFDILYSLYPETDLWNIGGEISNPDVNTYLMTPEAYMAKFKALYEHARRRYPGVVLVSGPTFGSASTGEFRGGPAEFERLIQLGLADLDIIIAVNVYTHNALFQYSAIFDRYADKLRKRPVWVTETGASVPGQQGWVKDTYPQIQHLLRPEMICWYVMWAGDIGGDSGFGLINGIDQLPFEERDLFKALTRGVR